MGRKAYDGRVEDAAAECAAPGCRAPGEYRAPLTPGTFDGPGAYRLMCLDCIRKHNAGYDFFAGMSAEEILAAQSPIQDHPRRVRSFGFVKGGDPGPAWQDFTDPLDAISARFRGGASMKQARASARFSGSEQQALQVLGLKPDTDLHAVRGRYSELVRRYHPDRNGGDRSQEARLTRVIDAWQTLRKAKAFA
ncbi:J domain-containing protein [Sphingomicrobium clamense]|uniref:J domain-containing protein n=1 Tax=Sphingomicrobium clamense TaxID=2851013 RepID=A0ABS6V3M6_9SPHN|nr:J domain-containing protein [Sphingomicrobium sp. B8]MBW0144162.1 J domain-containing protein [Sphingomicrobium sp. B8]